MPTDRTPVELVLAAWLLYQSSHAPPPPEPVRDAPRRRERKAEPKDRPSAGRSQVLEAIAACESGGDPTAVSPSGRYRGLFQFDRRTWHSVGGTGDPASASRAEQYRRAELLYQRRSTQPWPNCP